MKKVKALQTKLRKSGSKKNAVISQKFFKTGPGGYSEGDIFLGLKVPQVRTLVKEFLDLSPRELTELLKSPYHEERLSALLIMVSQFEKSAAPEQRKGYAFYLKNIKYVNNWDLVDATAPNIVGKYLIDKKRSELYKLAKSKNLWARRIAIVSTLTFIKAGDFVDAFSISKQLLKDEHDLIHKAVGWMLREIGKKETGKGKAGQYKAPRLSKFLKENYANLPRTTLRYAIEHFPEKTRKQMLNGKF